MPFNPFNKSNASDADIDLSLFSHIHNDPFITGAFKLEGSTFRRTIGYFNRYCKDLGRNQALPDAVLTLQRKMHKIFDIEMQMERISASALPYVKNPAEIKLSELSKAIANDILVNLKENEYLSMPGGWSTPAGGHAMVYQFKRTATGVEFYIHNAGDGIRFHERQSSSNQELYYPVQAYSIPLPIDNEKLADFLRDLMLPQLPKLRERKNQHFDANILYKQVIPRLSFLSARLIPMARPTTHAFTGGQLSGTCAERSWHQMLKENFDTLANYQQFIYQYKRYALDDFIRVLQRDNGLRDPRVQILIKRAMNTMVRTLNIPGLFSAEYIETERAGIRGYRDLLKRTGIEGNVVPEKPIPQTAFTTTFKLNFPNVLRPSTSKPAAYPLIDPQPFAPLAGGANLLAEMSALIQQCQQLIKAGKYPSVIEGLELVLAHFPLPVRSYDFESKIAFYGAIDSKNQAEFYRLIDLLQTNYLDACRRQSSNAALPRMLVVGLSMASVLDYVTSQLPLGDKNAPTFHSVQSSILANVLDGNAFNPYFATNSPLLDARMQAIKSLYSQRKNADFIGYYAGIVDSEPALKAKLLERYRPPAEPILARLLGEGKIRELFWLTTAFDELARLPEFLPLINKLKTQKLIEQMTLKGIKAFWGREIDLFRTIKLTLNYNNTSIVAESVAVSTNSSSHDRHLLDYKYGLSDSIPVRRALTLDYAQDFRNRYTDYQGKVRSENQIQLYPSDILHSKLEDMKDEVKAVVADRQIDRLEVVSRELFHLRVSPHNQIKLTLDYFLRHLSKLADPSIQVYIEANLFEPRLLADELDKNPDILKQVDRFIDKGLKHYAKRGCTSQQSVFFIRLAYLVDRYAAEYKPGLFCGRLDALQQRLASLVQLNAEHDAAIKQSLYQYQFLTAMARFRLNPELVNDPLFLTVALSTYFYTNAKNNPHAFIDTATQFELDCAKNDVQRLILQGDQQLIGNLVCSTLANLGLGVYEGAPEQNDNFYSVWMKKGGRQYLYKVDLARGLVFNEHGMAYSPTPLGIVHHPVMQYLNVKNLEPCFTSNDGLVFELGESELRFIRITIYSGYRVQKQWTVNGQTQWYELHDLGVEQKKAFGLDTMTILPPFPDILKQRDTQIWLACDKQGSALITESNQPTYRYSAIEALAKQLNELGCDNGFTLCTGKTWFHDFFATFEDASFITVCQNTDTYQIEFGRYGLTLRAKIESGHWVFRLENNPSFVFVENANTLFPGATGLIFADDLTTQRTCYMPVQQFIRTDGPSPRSEFHNLKQDIAAIIPKSVVKDSLGESKSDVLLPWQYTGVERVIGYQLDKTGQPIPENPCDALYLCYVYLGSQHPEKAWAVLEDCAKRLGGLQGTVEELSLLQWIIKSLPCIVKAEDDTDAIISTPSYVACQLKALALFTSAFTPDKIISFPSKTFDLQTPDGRYQEKCWKGVSAFHNGLNGVLYSLYSRFQHMTRHVEHGFQLKDDERKSLLDYYHFHLPDDAPKVLGALGYEWQRLQIKALKKECNALQAEQHEKGKLPAGYQKRLAEIDTFLKQDELVSKNHTNVELLPLNLSIPNGMSIELGEIKMGRDGQHGCILAWWYNFLNARDPASGIPDAMAALNPEIVESDFVEYFPSYYHLVMSPNRSNEQDQLLDFCRQYLMASRHIPLAKQEHKIAYLCNILYRIAEHRARFTAVRLGSRENRFSDVLEQAGKLPDPTLKIYQLELTTDRVLAGARDIWASLEPEVPAPGKPMIAAPCEALIAFNLEAMYTSCHLALDLQQQGQQYKAQAAIFGVAPAIRPLTASAVQVLSPTERSSGVAQYDALCGMRDIAGKMLAKSATRSALGATAQSFITGLDGELQKRLAEVLRLANAGPTEPVQKSRRELELEGAARTPLDLSRLLALYFRADKAMYAVETGLAGDLIDDLHTKLSHYLALSARQQALQRFCKQLSDAFGQEPDSSTLQLMAHELLIDDQVDYQNEPVLAMLQYHENVLLRPQQIAAIKRLLASPDFDKYAFCESIEKVIMGGGKSKVILPVLAESKATGSNLVVIEVPPALFETNCVDLASTSGRLFNQKARPFVFNRDSNCSPESLQFRYAELLSVIANKDYLVTTGDSVQSLEMKYLEVLFQRPDDEEERKVWKQQVEGLGKIVLLFRTRADVLMDEVHQALLLKKKLNYTLGDRQAIATEIITESVELYRFFDHVALADVLGEAFRGKSLTQLLENNQLIIDGAEWDRVIKQLTWDLVWHQASPLQAVFQRVAPPISDDDKHELLRYLANEGTDIPGCVLRSNKKTKTIFALYKEQVSQLLSQTLKRNLNEHYGASQLRSGDGLAIPYVANNVPSERSRFGNYLEGINFTIQMLMIDGFRGPSLKHCLQGLQEQARQELLKEPLLGTIDNTPTGLGFQSWTVGSTFSLNEIHLEDDEQFKIVFNELCRNKNLMCEVLKADILPQIHVESEILHSDAYNHVDIYRSCQGVTGTPWNSSTYHQRLTFDKRSVAATDGFILAVLAAKQTAIRQVAHTSPDEYLAGLFEGKNAQESVRAIIDICAAFKGVSNVQVARSLAAYIRQHPAQFSIPTPLKYILFFNEANVLCALGIEDGSVPVPIGSTDPKVIDAKWGTPDQRFSYYDQAHTVGVDLKQGRRAKALVLVDHETPLNSYLQGDLRMRGLAEEQQVEIIVPANFDAMTHDALVMKMVANQKRLLEQDNFSAAQAKMTNIIRADFMKRLLALPGDDAQKQHEYAIAFKTYFVEKASQDFFELYGSLASMRPAKEILELQRDKLIKDWSDCLAVIDEVVVDTKDISDQLNQIITEALPLCQTTYLSPTRQEHGKEVEVQKQVQIEMQREAQLQRELFNPSLEPLPYKNFDLLAGLRDNKDIELLSLTNICRQSSPTAPEFGRIYASSNYYNTYKNQTQVIGAFLKPVHALLFHQDMKGILTCLILSQRDAEDLAVIMSQRQSPGFWMTTTQHTVLAGSPSLGINENSAYQAMIEKLRFFNGEFNLLLDGDVPLSWLSNDSGKKLAFFEQHLLPYRETAQADMIAVRQTMSQRQKAFQYIADHPLEDYQAFEWRAWVSDDLTDADIDEAERLALAFANTNRSWNDADFNAKKCQDGLRLSIQAASYLDRYVAEQLPLLRAFLAEFNEGAKAITADGMIRNLSDLPQVFLKEYIPGDKHKRQTILQLVLKKAANGHSREALMNVAQWLVDNGSDLHAVDGEGYNALEIVINDKGKFVFEIASWLIDKGICLPTTYFCWFSLGSAIMEKFLTLPACYENEVFLRTYVALFKADEVKLREMLDLCPVLPNVLQDIIRAIVNPTSEFLDQLFSFDLDKMYIESMFKALPYYAKPPISLLLRLVATPELLKDVVIYASQYESHMLASFWKEVSNLRWYELDSATLGIMLRRLSAAQINQLFEAIDALDNVDGVINKLIESGNQIVFLALLSNPQIKLEPRHLEMLLATDTAKQILPQIIGHSAADKDVFQCILDAMGEPTEIVLQALLANAEFITNTDLVQQLLAVLHRDVRIWFIRSVSFKYDVQPDMLTVFLDRNNELDVATYITLYNKQQSRLDDNHLKLMVDVFSQDVNILLTHELSGLLQQMISHEKASASVRQQVVNYTLRFGKPAMEMLEPFWLVLCGLEWSFFDDATLNSMMLLLPDGLINALFKSSDFIKHEKLVINKLVQDGALEVFSKLLNHQQIKLEASHLLTHLGRFYVGFLQEILPHIAAHDAADKAVLQKVIAVMDVPTDELLSVLLTNAEFIKNPDLVEQLFDKVSQDKWQVILLTLSVTPGLDPALFDIIINRSKGLEPSLIFSNLFDQYSDALTTDQLISLSTVLFAAPFSQITLTLMKRIMMHGQADVQVLEQLVNYASQLTNTGEARDFWTNLSLKHWEQFEAATIGQMFLDVSDEYVDTLLNSAIFKDNQRVIIDKLIHLAKPRLYRLLLENNLVTLEKKDLIACMTSPKQEFLPPIAGHPAADKDVWEHIIGVMTEPAERLIAVFLAKEQFTADTMLVKQLLAKMSDGVQQEILITLSSKVNITAEIVAAIIQHSDKVTIEFYNDCLDNHGDKLGALELKRMVTNLSAEGIPSSEEFSLILQRIMSHKKVDFVVLDKIVHILLKFWPDRQPQLMNDCWTDVSRFRWDELEGAKLTKIFLELPADLIDMLCQSASFQANQNTIIDKLFLSASPAIYLKLLDCENVALEPRHLLTLVTGLDSKKLPQIARHPAANEAVLKKIIEVMKAPVDDVLTALLMTDNFLTNVTLVRQLLATLGKDKHQLVLAALLNCPGISVEAVQILIEKNKKNVAGLIDIFNQQHFKLTHDHLLAMLPSSHDQAQVWLIYQEDISTLLLAMLEDELADDVLTKAVMHCALALVSPDALFWTLIPNAKVNLDWSENNLGSKLDDELKKIFAALHHVDMLNLSNNKLDKKDAAQLADILATLPPNLTTLDLSGNGIDSKSKLKIMTALPPGIANIAFENHELMPIAVAKAQCTDYSFLFNCLASVALVAGGAALVVGLFVLNPLIAAIGLSVVATVLIGAALSQYGLFANKPKQEIFALDEVVWPAPAV